MPVTHPLPAEGDPHWTPEFLLWSADVEQDLNVRLSDGSLSTTYSIANPTLAVTYNGDGTVATTTENGVLTTFTYNADGTVNTQTRAGVTKTFAYDGSGNVTGAS